ncbi:4-carboxymuconolactone decarboxylase [Saccharopolyspora hattusasensis]|uniref:4-carboxymuconolactone decarboxylase n=1 Tax=Saccharopolyspora hattusasensis TaxID=1128679 RepID=UPI003D99629D
MDERDRFEQGMNLRRKTLGDDWVDSAATATTDFSADFQEMVTRYSWGEVWSRDTLPRSTRSLVTIGMTVALNRPEDFRGHVRAVLRGGVTPEEIREVLMQTAIYCGVSAADSAFRATEEILAELGLTTSSRADRNSEDN